jgi:hypothetical protein
MVINTKVKVGAAVGKKVINSMDILLFQLAAVIAIPFTPFFLIIPLCINKVTRKISAVVKRVFFAPFELPKIHPNSCSFCGFIVF